MTCIINFNTGRHKAILKAGLAVILVETLSNRFCKRPWLNREVEKRLRRKSQVNPWYVHAHKQEREKKKKKKNRNMPVSSPERNVQMLFVFGTNLMDIERDSGYSNKSHQVIQPLTNRIGAGILSHSCFLWLMVSDISYPRIYISISNQSRHTDSSK